MEIKAGRPIEGPLQLLEITTYSLSGKRIENVSYPVGTSSVGKEEYKYDDKGNIVEMTLRGDDGSILSREKYDYELDTFGNWTKMVTSLIVFEGGELKSEPIEVTYRTLAYYFNDTIAQIIDSTTRPIVLPPTAATGAAMSNPVAHEMTSNQLTLRDQPASSVEVRTDATHESAKTPEIKETVSPARDETESGAKGSNVEAVTPATSSPESASAEVSGGAVADAKNIASNVAPGDPKNIASNAPAADPNNVAPNVSAERKRSFDYYKTGRELFDSGAVKEAVAAYQQSLKLEPKSAEVHLSLGHAYLRLKQNQQALKSFKQATLLEPEMAEAHYGLGLSYFNISRYKEAADAFKRATLVRPDLGKAHYGLALAYQELGNEDAVVTEFRILETLDRGLAKKLAASFPEFNLPCRVPPFCK